MHKQSTNRRLDVEYFAICNGEPSSGVYKKITGLCTACAELGFACSIELVPSGRTSHLRLALAIFQSCARLVIVRGNSYAAVTLLASLSWVRLTGRHVLVDVPTPNAVVLREIATGGGSIWAKAAKMFAFSLSGPWCMWPSSRILQYAPEGWWFALGCKKKTKLVGNGIDVRRTPLRGRTPEWPGPQLRLVGVAELAHWHGYDLVVRALHRHLRAGATFAVHFTVIGGGAGLAALKILVRELGVEDHVVFRGPLGGEELHAEYDRAHVGVGSVALHRKGLTVASELKAREYCCAGLPFVSSGIDPDFPDGVAFRFVLCSRSDQERIDELVALFQDLSKCKLPDPAVVRAYAVDHLDYRAKVRAQLAGLLS